MIYIKIPSEVVPDFYYDTVIEFYPNDKPIVGSNSLSDYYVKFYSNDPAFVYTYAHAFIKNELFIEDLKPKMSKLAVKKEAKLKNPQNTVGFCKSLYFAWLVIKSRGLLNKTHYIMAKEYNKNNLINMIEDADIKIADRQKHQEIIDKKEKKKKETEKRSQDKKSSISSNSTKVVTSTNKVKKTGGAKKSKVIGKK